MQDKMADGPSSSIKNVKGKQFGLDANIWGMSSHASHHVLNKLAWLRL